MPDRLPPEATVADEYMNKRHDAGEREQFLAASPVVHPQEIWPSRFGVGHFFQTPHHRRVSRRRRLWLVGHVGIILQEGAMAARRKRPDVPRRHGSPRRYEVAVAAIVATSAAALVNAPDWISTIEASFRTTPGGRRRRGAVQNSAVRSSAATGRHTKRGFISSLLVVGDRRAKVNLIGFALALAPWVAIGAYSALSRPAAAPNTALAASSIAPAVPSLDETIEIVPLDSPTPSASAATQVVPVHMTLHSEQQLVAVANHSLATTGLPTMATIAVPPGATSIPRVALIAYVNAATRQQKVTSYCNLNWSTLAAIGYIESDHAKSGGSASATWNGIAAPRILGPELNGTNGYASIPDTDRGLLDGDTKYDRAIGPMQFLPSTWQEYAVSATPGRWPDPENIFDATEAAARYLCADGLDLRVPANLVAAIYGYNHSLTYVDNVITVAGSYAAANPAEVAAAFAAAQTLFARGGPQPVSAAESAVGIAATPPGTISPTPSASPTSAPVYWPVAPNPIATGAPTTLPSSPASPTQTPTATDSADPASPSASPSTSLTPAPTTEPSPAPTPTASLTPTPTLAATPSASASSPPASSPARVLPSSPPVVASPNLPASVTPSPVPTAAQS
jgi:membrane-bound lytic murein transglycosylase B